MSPAMLTLVAAVEVYERVCEGREIVDWLSLLPAVLGFALAWESRKAMSWTREEKDIVRRADFWRVGRGGQ
jgi:hypothetical protein